MHADGHRGGEIGIHSHVPAGGVAGAGGAGATGERDEVGARGVGRPLDLEQLIAWRREGLSYLDIARESGTSESAVARYAKKHLPPELRKRKGRPWKTLSARQRVTELLDSGWADRTGREIAAEAGCSIGLVYYVKRERRERAEREKVKRGRKCDRCELYEEARNPVDDSGLCFWCRLEAQGVSLLGFHESGAAVEFWEASDGQERQKVSNTVCVVLS